MFQKHKINIGKKFQAEIPRFRKKTKIIFDLKWNRKKQEFGKHPFIFEAFYRMEKQHH